MYSPQSNLNDESVYITSTQEVIERFKKLHKLGNWKLEERRASFEDDCLNKKLFHATNKLETSGRAFFSVKNARKGLKKFCCTTSTEKSEIFSSFLAIF